MPLLPGRHRCLVLGSDGLWNMISPEEAVSIVTDLEVDFEERVIHDPVNIHNCFSYCDSSHLSLYLIVRDVTLRLSSKLIHN